MACQGANNAGQIKLAVLRSNLACQIEAIFSVEKKPMLLNGGQGAWPPINQTA
jgi:hypothetical protein